MRLADITADLPVLVRSGYVARPAVVTRVWSDGRVSVRFTDVPAGTVLPAGHGSNVYGAVVRPNAVEAAPAAAPDLVRTTDGGWKCSGCGGYGYTPVLAVSACTCGCA